MALQFRKAERSKVKAKIAIPAPTGGGKTYTGLVFASLLARLAEGEGKVAVLDSEGGRAELYADDFEFETFTPDMFPVPYVHTPENYMAVIEAAIQNGYGALLIDSLSHEWIGRGGILEMVDAEKARTRNEFGAWNGLSQRHRKLLEYMVSAPIHIVATMRADMDYILEPGRNGGMVPKKVGLAPQQRKGSEYEFDVIFELDADGTGVITKTRFKDLRGIVSKLPETGLGHVDVVNKLMDALEKGAGAREPMQLPKDALMDEPPPTRGEEKADLEEPPDGEELAESYRCNAVGAKTKQRCSEIIYRDGDYQTSNGEDFKGALLIVRGKERWNKVFCYPHYTMKAKIEDDKAAMQEQVDQMKAEDGEAPVDPPQEKPKSPRKKKAEATA